MPGAWLDARDERDSDRILKRKSIRAFGFEHGVMNVYHPTHEEGASGSDSSNGSGKVVA